MAKLKNAALTAQHGELLGLGRSTVTAAPFGRNWLAILTAISIGMVGIGGTVGYIAQKIEVAKYEREQAELAERRQFAGLYSKADKMREALGKMASPHNMMLVVSASLYERDNRVKLSQEQHQMAAVLSVKCPPPEHPDQEEIDKKINAGRDADKKASAKTGETPELNAAYTELKAQLEPMADWSAGLDAAMSSMNYGPLRLTESFQKFCDSDFVEKTMKEEEPKPVAKPAAPAAATPAPAPVVEAPAPVVEAQVAAPVAPAAPPPTPPTFRQAPPPAPKPQQAPAQTGRVKIDNW